MDFRIAEREVRRHSAELKKELRLGDLVLTQILFITGLFWFGTAGKLGSSHIMFWIPAVLLFYIPSGMVVVHLNQEMPLEGGIYQWAKLRFGDAAGFLVAWNIWASTVLSLSMMTSQLVDNLAAAFGPSGAWIAESKWITVISGAVMISGLMVVAVRGLALGRWIHDAGGLTLIVILAAMAAFALPRWFRGEAAVAPVAFSFPAVSMLNLNILGKMSFGAFFGFDGAAIFSGELRDPHVARSMRRSVWLAAPVIALIYILGTACVLVFTRPDSIDLISPAAQALTRGAQGMGAVGFVAPLAAVLLICHVVGYSSLSYNAVIRLPMVAGWDHLLPAWFSRLHPRYKTPVGSIVFIGLMAFVFVILGNLGVGAQEAFQLLGNGSIICYALTYLVMFAIPLVARGEKPAWGVRLAAVCGFAMTLLYTVLSIFPIIDVKDAASFTLKVSGVVIGINVAGVLYFRHAQRTRQQQ
jgi:amino acid transporter